MLGGRRARAMVRARPVQPPLPGRFPFCGGVEGKEVAWQDVEATSRRAGRLATRMTAIQGRVEELEESVQRMAALCRGCRATLGAALLVIALFTVWEAAGAPPLLRCWWNCSAVMPASW